MYIAYDTDVTILLFLMFLKKVFVLIVMGFIRTTLLFMLLVELFST